MDFAFVGATSSETFGWFARGLREVMESEGHRYMEDSGDAKLILNFFPPTRPRPVRRKANAVFVCAVTEFPVPFTQHLSQGYPSCCARWPTRGRVLPSSDGGDADIHFVTPEQGHYVVSGGLDRENFFREVYTRIEPLAASTLVIDNIFEPDLPEELWHGDDITESIYRAGKHLEGLNLLPAPFPIHDYLAERDLRHLKRLFGIGGSATATCRHATMTSGSG